MKSAIPWTLITVGAILVVLGLFFYLSPVKQTQNNVMTVPSGVDVATVEDFIYSKGVKLEGYLTIRNGNEEITFRLEDPYGVTTLNPGLITSRYDFAFTTAQEGIYRLSFINNENASKAVYLTIKQTLIGGESWWLLLAGIGALILVLGLCALSVEKRNKG